MAFDFDEDWYYGSIVGPPGRSPGPADRVEDQERQHTLTFDVIRGRHLLQIQDQLPLSSSLDRETAVDIPARVLACRGTVRQWRESVPGGIRELTKNSWCALRLRRQGIPTALHVGPTGRPIPAWVGAVRAAEPAESDALANLLSLANIPSPQDDDWTMVSEAGTKASELHVYDVGQGSCAALADTDHTPVVYFDFGGGCGPNKRTWPQAGHLCTCRPNCVILSHWDWDHWSSADRFSEILDVLWIAPEQVVGPTQLGLAARLHANGRLKLIRKTDRLPNAGPLHLSLGTGRSRNDSGIVVKWNSKGATALIPGDCSPRAWPTLLSGPFDAFVAPHHGGRSRGSSPKAVGNGRLAYSFGKGNTYRHPLPASVASNRVNWHERFDTPDGNILLLPGGNIPMTSLCACRLRMQQG